MIFARLGGLYRRAGTSELFMRVARGSMWVVTGALATRLLTLGSSIVLARILGKERLGEGIGGRSKHATLVLCTKPTFTQVK